jgi:hypothetical protein
MDRLKILKNGFRGKLSVIDIHEKLLRVIDGK